MPLPNVQLKSMVTTKINIEIAYVSHEEQTLLCLQVAEGCPIEQAIHLSGILQLHPEIDLAHNSVGVFSEKRQLTDIVNINERIEIYRPLLIDPKHQRREKAKR